MNLLVSQPKLRGAGRRQVSESFFVLNPVLLEVHTAIKPLVVQQGGQEERTGDWCI